MDLRAKITDAVYEHIETAAEAPGTSAERIIRAVTEIVEACVLELEDERDLLRRQLQAARGERPGTWDTCEEHAARKQATPAEPPVKPRLSLEEARLQAARARDKEEK